jgi:hypothetical protein
MPSILQFGHTERLRSLARGWHGVTLSLVFFILAECSVGNWGSGIERALSVRIVGPSFPVGRRHMRGVFIQGADGVDFDYN